MKLWFIGICSLLAGLSSVVRGECETFTSSCQVALGQSLHYTSGSNYIKLGADDDYYVTFSMPVDTKTVDVDISVMFGAVRIFCAVNRKPSPSDFDFGNAFSGQTDHLSITPATHSATDKFNVLIKASPTSTVYMVGAVSTAAKPLLMAVNGMPQSVRMGRGSSLQVQFPVVSTAPVNVLVTAYSAFTPASTLSYLPMSTGPPVLYPRALINNDTDTSEGFLSFTPRAADVGKTFVLQLFSQNMSYASVAVRTGIEKGAVIGTAAKDPPQLNLPTHTVVLQSGLPQKDRVGEQQERYYVFYVPPGVTSSVTITVDPVQGDSDLFVNPTSRGIYHSQGTDPLPVWSSMRASGIDSVTIGPKDRDFVSTGGAYYITVFGYDAAQFMVRVTSQDAATVLVEGYTVQDSVSKGQYMYYRFHDTAPTSSIMFDLLPTSGDADMMIACAFRPTGTDAGSPSKLHHNFTSQMYLEDSILIAPSDPNSCSLGAAGDDSTHRGEGGVFYLAVYGYSDAAYMLSAQHQYGVRTLVAGVPTSGIAYRSTQQHYRVRVGFQAAELRILLSPLYGDADLYVRMNAPADLSTFDFQSRNFNTRADTVVISEEQVCEDCWVYVLVYGFATTEYSLLASFSDGTVTLTNGVPQRGSVASSSLEYYNYQATADCTVTVVATVISGTPSLYLSKTVEYPDASSADTTTYLPDSGSGFLPRIELAGVTAGQALHLAVAGGGHNVTYTIRIYETPAGPHQPPVLLTLPSGMPQEDSIASTSSGWLYYQVSAPIGHETLSIRTSTQVGYVELYILKCPPLASAYQCSLSPPNMTHYLQTSADTDRSFVNVFRNDDAPSLYAIGVYSTSFYSVYQISASLESSTLALQAGVSVMDHVSKGEVDYFSFFMDQAHVKLKIALTTLSGDPDIFVSTTVQHPAADDTNSTWRSTEYGADVLVIDPRLDRRACVHCVYYIAVVGRAESTYTIAATTSSNLPRLGDGVPSAGSVAYQEWAYYSFSNIYGTTRDIHVNLVSATGNADLYVTLDGSIPTFSNNAYSSAQWYSNDGVDILHTDAAYAACASTATAASNCNIIVGVFGTISSVYTLTLTSSSAATLLQLDTVRTDSVPFHQSRFYRLLLFQASLAPYTLRFLVTPFTGHVQLFVACDTMLPNATNHQWSLTPDTGSGSYVDILSVAAADKGCARINAQYYASVYGDSAASYSIQASIVGNSTVPLLVPGLAHSAVVSLRRFDYYFVRPGSVSDDLRLLATVLQGDVDIYVSYTYDTRPRVSSTGAVSSYVLSSAKSGSEDMTIRHGSVQAACSKRTDCYFIVGVLGTSGTSRYSLMALTPDSTIQLSSGVPRQSHVDSASYEYFKFTLTQPDLDLIVSVTPISGDPDLFISVAPNTHPTRSNYTWFQSKFGADTMTLQYSEVAKHCDITRRGHCDIHIGVYGWQNTSFTVMAAVDEGFLSPVTLIDQAPQSGFVATAAYTYYRYSISVPPGSGEELPPVDIKFTLTPTDDGDADLFLLVERKGNKTEPGTSNYDLRSVGWGSVTEMITLSADMPVYCFDCTVYLAVFGYRACAYTIQASSSGVIELQAGQAIGGHVTNEKFAYYSMHNPNQFGLMKFTLTMISEDADLYIIPHRHGAPFDLPTRTHYTWRSLYVGSDVLSVDYQDRNFCFDCDYIVGVYGYHNSTYTLMVTDQEDSIIKLVQNRPQIAAIRARDGTLYFSAVISSSIADTTVTLTSLDNGQADLYVQVYSSADFYAPSGGDYFRLPDPDVPGSYAYTTHGSQADHVLLPGPHPTESILVVLVKALSAVRFSIVATSSQSPVLLLSGQPQNHYVGFGVNEYFKFYPHADEDLHITLTARSGDPDLFVSTIYQKPQCNRVTNTYYTTTVCSNYTYSSRNYMTDQLILSRDSPCSAVMPGTTVSLECDPQRAYNPGSGEPIYIGVYGYAAAQFTLLVAPEGQSIELFPGQPQLYRTSPGYICSSRSAATGACSTSAGANKKVEVAYFSLRISAPSAPDAPHKRMLMESYRQGSGAGAGGSLQSVFDVVVSVLPACNTSRLPDSAVTTLDTCAPGCDCAPLTVYVNSCPLSKCTQLDRKPSELYGQHKAVHTVKAGGSSLVLSASAAESNSKSFCDPSAAGEDCAYFFAVVAAPLPSASPNLPGKVESASFTITARTPGDMILIPCVADGNPDGIQFAAEDTIVSSSASEGGQPQLDRQPFHYYELCSQRFTDASLSAENLVVELEQCAGSTALYACSDASKCAAVLPTAQSWAYYADSAKTCSHSADPRIRDSCISAVRSRPSLTLPQRDGNYFLMANGTGRFEIRIQNTVNAIHRSPLLVYAGMQSKEAAAVSVGTVTGNTVSLQWQQARVLIPGAMNALTADYMSYTAYIFDTRATDVALLALAQKGVRDVRFDSKCGLVYATQVLPAAASTEVRAVLKAAEQGADYMTHTFEHLAAKTNYRLVLVASCDSACLRQLSKVTSDPHVLISCSDSKRGDCKPQSTVYLAAEFMTGDRDDGTTRDDDAGAGESDDSFVRSMVTFSTVVMVLLILALVGLSAYWVKNNGREMYAWLEAVAQGGLGAVGSGSGGGAGRRTWAATDNEEGEEDFAGVNSAHGLTGSRASSNPSAASTAPSTSRSFMAGLSGASRSAAAASRKKETEAHGVELEDLSYAPPSIGSNSSSSSGRSPADPIDFRGGAGSSGGSAINVGEALSGAASKIFTAASSAVSAVSSKTASIDAWNPLHRSAATSTSRAGPTAAGYSAVGRSASQQEREEPELHL